jgi:hypothetical protein
MSFFVLSTPRTFNKHNNTSLFILYVTQLPDIATRMSRSKPTHYTYVVFLVYKYPRPYSRTCNKLIINYKTILIPPQLKHGPRGARMLECFYSLGLRPFFRCGCAAAILLGLVYSLGFRIVVWILRRGARLRQNAQKKFIIFVQNVSLQLFNFNL